MRMMCLCIIGLLALVQASGQDTAMTGQEESVVQQKEPSRREKELKIFPNPVTDNQFRINLGSRYTGAAEVLVFSSTGKVVYQERQPVTGDQVVPVTMPHKLPGGVYTVHVVMGDAVRKGRLVAAN